MTDDIVVGHTTFDGGLIGLDIHLSDLRPEARAVLEQALVVAKVDRSLPYKFLVKFCKDFAASVKPKPVPFEPTIPTGWGTPTYRGGGRTEWSCKHADGSWGPGHGNHVHGCDGCCSHKSYPGKSL